MNNFITTFKQLFLNKTFFKFLAVGVLNTLFGMAIMFGFYNILHLNYWISSAANYFFGSILSYFLNKHFTFKNTEKGLKPILRFALSISVCYIISYGIAKPLVSTILSSTSKIVQDNGAMLVGMGLFVITNYIGQRFFAFSKKENEK